MLCRRERIAESLYYSWSNNFLDAGKKLHADAAPGTHGHGTPPGAFGYRVISEPGPGRGAAPDKADAGNRIIPSPSPFHH